MTEKGGNTMNAVIIGGGETGAYVAKLLSASNCRVRVIACPDEDPGPPHDELPDEIFIRGDCTSPDAMIAAGIEDADVVAAVTGRDDVNLVAATIAKYEFGVPRVIGLVNQPRNQWLFSKEMGVDIYIGEASLLARVMVDEMDLPSMVTMMTMNRGSHAISRFTVEQGAFADGRLVRALAVPNDSVLIAIQRGNHMEVTRGDTKLSAGDRILALCTESGQKALDNMFTQK